MVLRKPVATTVTAPQAHQPPNTQPYPVTPRSPTQGTGTRTNRRAQPSASWEDVGMESQSQKFIPTMSNGWADVDIDTRKKDAPIPATLKVGGTGTASENPWGDEGFPTSLRPNSPETPRSSFDSQRSTGLAQKRPGASEPNGNVPQSLSPNGHHSNNPYLRSTNPNYTVPEIARPQEVSSANIWGELSASPPPSKGAPLSSSRKQSNFDIPIAQTAALNIADESPYSALSSHEPWASAGPQPPRRQAPSVPAELPTTDHGTISAQSSLISFTSEEVQNPRGPTLPGEPQTGSVAYPAEPPRRKAPSVPAELPTNDHGTISAHSSLIPFTLEEVQNPRGTILSGEPQTGSVAYPAEPPQDRAPPQDGAPPQASPQGPPQAPPQALPQAPLQAPPRVPPQAPSQDVALLLRSEGPPTFKERPPPAGPFLAANKHLPALPPSLEPVDASHLAHTIAEPVKTEKGSNISAADAEAQRVRATKQRSETYQIKLINWYDASSSSNPRTSPILVQNANGPCPLLALVNALTLSTPADVNTALVETLRVREQVSLGLLLDAVFDELTSGRRGDAAQELPDVGDLYSFLITLHTGMNVNPCFISAQTKPPNIMDASVLNLPDTVQPIRRAGGFEETREMRLYSTFAVPLIHGWLPPRNHPAYAALYRSAQTYEDAQNLMFREEELEDKLQREGLSQEEQHLLEDIASINFFLSSTATQLTGYGLDIMNKTLSPGSIAILFRNDHFSNLYKHPKSGQLLTLVTDMGYAGHAEVVWESLVDVSGEGCEYFSGDFRPVGNVAGSSQSQTNGTTSADDQGWTTVSRATNSNKSRQSHPLNTNINNDQDPPLSQTFDLATSPSTEQEDHDLALAMQLQEEEEDRSRQQALARQREDELSQAYLNSQQPSNRRGQTSRPGQFEPPARARGTGRIIGQDIRPLVPPRGGSVVRDPERGDDAPPPSYEQAAKGPAYHPPPNHPAHPSAPPVSPAAESPTSMPPRPTMQGTRPRQVSAYSQNAAAYGGAPSTHGPGRRRSSVARSPVTPIRAPGYDGQPILLTRRSGLDAAEDEARRDKDCVVM